MDYTTEQHSDLLKQITVKADQRAVIAITDEYAKPIREAGKKSMRGALAKYARPELREKEKGAWKRAVAEKFENS